MNIHQNSLQHTNLPIIEHPSAPAIGAVIMYWHCMIGATVSLQANWELLSA
jgi:hypothetical protein